MTPAISRDGRFIRVSLPYHPRLLACFREAIPWRSRQYDPGSRTWLVRPKYEGAIRELLADYDVEVAA